MYGFDPETTRRLPSPARRGSRDRVVSRGDSGSNASVVPYSSALSIKGSSTSYEVSDSSSSATTDSLTLSVMDFIASNEVSHGSTSATAPKQDYHLSSMPDEIKKMIIKQAVVPNNDIQEYDLTCRLIDRSFANIGEEVMGLLHRHNRCRLPNTLKYDRSIKSCAIMAAVTGSTRFAPLITELACSTPSERDIPRPDSLETALLYLPNLTRITCNARNVSDYDDDETRPEDLDWGSLCDVSQAAHNLAMIEKPLNVDTIDVRVGPWLQLVSIRSQRYLHTLFSSIKHLRIDFVRDRTARVKAHKRSSRNHLWDRNQPATWPEYYLPENDEVLSWGALLASTMDNLESLTFAGHDTFGCAERRIEDVITGMRWKKLTRFTIGIGEARQDRLIDFLEAHPTLTYIDLRYLRLYHVVAVWDGVPRMRRVWVSIGGQWRVIQETQEDRDRRVARRQAIDSYANYDADDEAEDRNQTDDDDADSNRSVRGTPPPAPTHTRSAAPEPQSEQDRASEPRLSIAHPHFPHLSVFDRDSDDTATTTDHDVDDFDSDRDDGDDRWTTYTSVDTVRPADRMDLVDALARLKNARPMLQTVRHVIRGGWVHQSDELLDHWVSCWRSRDVPGMDFASFVHYLYDVAIEMGVSRKVSWDIGPL